MPPEHKRDSSYLLDESKAALEVARSLVQP